MLNLLSFMPTGSLLPAAAIAAGVLVAAIGVQTVRVKHAQAETVEVRNAWALDRANAQGAALVALNKYRADEAEWRADVQKAQADYEALQTTHDRALADQRTLLAVNGRLRNDIAAYAAGGGASAPDTAAAASDRASTLGQLLAGALQADADHARDAEANADAFRSMLSAWPAVDASIALPKA